MVLFKLVSVLHCPTSLSDIAGAHQTRENTARIKINVAAYQKKKQKAREVGEQRRKHK